MFSARMRIAFGLVCMLATVLLLAMLLGFVPDRRSAVMDGRKKLCESIAVNGSILANRRDIPRLEAILRTIVERNDDILSAAIRRGDGKLVVDAAGQCVAELHDGIFGTAST